MITGLRTPLLMAFDNRINSRARVNMVSCATYNTRNFFLLTCIFMIGFWTSFVYVGNVYKFMPTNYLKMVNLNRSSVFDISTSRTINAVHELNATNTLGTLWNGVANLVNTSFHVSQDATPSPVSTPLTLCNNTPPHLDGPIPVVMDALSWEELNKLYPDVEEGGRWRPKHCKSRHHVGIVIAYRDRDAHLRAYLRHMHKVWRKQELDYGVYVIEQDAISLFNRGMLMNIGFVEALKVDNYTCFIFSDVDLLPENDMNIYGCPEQPRHLSVSIDTHGYELMYKTLFGGVENFRTEHYRLINGFSNKYFGWGAEDDDLYERVIRKKLKLTRPPIEIARYKMQVHKKAPGGRDGMKYLETSHSRFDWDGLNSLQYKVVKYDKRPLYTLISVIIDQKAILETWSFRHNFNLLGGIQLRLPYISALSYSHTLWSLSIVRYPFYPWVERNNLWCTPCSRVLDA